MLTKEIVIDQITSDEFGNIMCRHVTRIMEDGAELSRTYHRTSLTPRQDVSNWPQKVQDICAAAWK